MSGNGSAAADCHGRSAVVATPPEAIGRAAQVAQTSSTVYPVLGVRVVTEAPILVPGFRIAAERRFDRTAEKRGSVD